MNSTTKELENATQIYNFTNQTGNDNFVLGAFYLVISILVMVANSVVVFVIAKTRELHLPTLWIIAHMAVWDFLYGLSYLVISVPSAFLKRFAYADRFIGWASSILTLILGQNLFNTAMVVVDRYIAIKHPLKYITISTKRKYVLTGFVSYLMNICRLLLTILPGLNFHYNNVMAVCISDFSTVGGRFASFSLMAITFVVIVYCSFMLLLELIRGRRRLRAEGDGGRGQVKLLKFSLMTVMTTAVYCSSYLPAVTSALMFFIFTGEGNSQWLSKLSFVAILSNSLWNVFIYTATYKPFRESLLSLFCTSYYRRQRQAEIKAKFRSQRRNMEVARIM